MLCVLLLIVVSSASHAASSERVLARVGERQITRELLNEEVERALNAQYFHQRLPKEQLWRLRREVLKLLIRRELNILGGLDKGLTLPLKEAEKQRAAIEEQLGRSEYTRSLPLRGWNRTDHRRALAETLLAEQAYRKFVLDQVAVDDAEIALVFQKQSQRFRFPEAYHLLHIFLRLSPDATALDRANKIKLAENLMRRLRDGENFSELARQYSEDAFRVKGGNLGWVHRRRLEKVLEEAVWRAQPGYLLGPIETHEGLHIVKIIGHREERPMTLEEAAPQIRQQLLSEKKAQAEHYWYDQTKKRHPVVVFDPELAGAVP